MSKQIAKNTFTGGLLMDLHPLSSQNTVLTNALNASLVTIDGDEMILLNDMGNLKVTYTSDNTEEDVTLTPGFIPIGVSTLNGIAYIVSYNPNMFEGEIGTFPSPNYNIDENTGVLIDDNNYTLNENSEEVDKSKLINKYQPLYNLYKGCTPTSCLEPKQNDDIKRLLYPLRTTHFNFSLEHPVTVNLQPSYDGSVNIIINDGYNIPRLINSRFSAKEDGTWEIPDRHRNTNNIYTVYEGHDKYEEPMCECDNDKVVKDGVKDIECGCINVSCEQELANQSLFDISTSLSKRVSTFPITTYNGVLNTGNLPVGNYTLYYKYCDEDGNETDFIGESGIISIFKGNDKDPFSIDGGERDMDSNKSINVTLKFNDTGYSFVKVYYSRTSAAADENRVSQAFEIIKTYPISDDGECNIIINGDEEKQLIPITELSQQLTIVNSAESQVEIGNRLFLGNTTSQKLFYDDLTNLSLYIVPYVKRQETKNKIGNINPKDYLDDSNLIEDEFSFTHEYYNTKNIYYNVGYWNEEYYRLGIVYIFEDGSLSPVFNILGYETISSGGNSGVIGDLRTVNIDSIVNFGDEFSIKPIKYNEDGYISRNEDLSFLNGKSQNIEETPDKYINFNTLNAKGVLRINDDEIKTYNANIDSDHRLNKTTALKENIPGNYIYNLGVYINEKIISELKNKYCIKGFFIVRQKRIPTILAQGFTMPWDKEAKVPIIEYWGKRHDFIRGTTISDRGLGTDKGIQYSTTIPASEFSLSKQVGNIYKAINRRCDIVESFLQLNGAEAFGMSDPKDSNYLTTLDDDHWENRAYDRAMAVHHQYLERLHEILPLTIDDEMICRLGRDGKAVSEFKPIYMKIKISGDWYYVNDKDENVKVDNPPLDYSEGELTEYAESLAMDLINRYVDSINSHELVDIGNYYDKNIGEIDYYTETPKLYKMNIKTILVNYCSNIDVENPNWNGTINLMNNNEFYEYYEYYTETSSDNTRDFVISGFKNGTYTIITTIPKVKEEGQTDTTYAKFIVDDVIGHGYSTINTYYSGLVIHRLTGEVWENDIPGNYKTYTAQSNQQDIPISYIADYYVNSRLNKDLYFHVSDNGSKYARTRYDRFRSVTDATKKHFWNLYKYCNKQLVTAICPEFEVRQPFFNQLFTGSEYTCRYNKYQFGILHRKSSNERYYYQNASSEDRLNWVITHADDLNNFSGELNTDKEHYIKYAMAEGVWLLEGNYADHKKRPYKIVSVTDSVPVVAIDNTIFKSVLGSEQEAFRFSFINEEHAPKRALKHIHGGKDRDKTLCNSGNDQDFNLIRGYYSPYLGMVCSEYEKDVPDGYDVYSDTYYWDNEKGRGYGRNFTIYDDSYNSDFKTNADIRIQDHSPYYAISERITFKNIPKYKGEVNGFDTDDEFKNIYYDLYRGDCFTYTFTHRLNRNFNDPVAPTNDHIINPTTWKDHFKPDDTSVSDGGITELGKINRGDVNAVKLGSWITVKGRSSYNLSIRSLDERYTSEAAMMGRARGFYPLQQASADGGYKIPNSYLINDGFGSTVGEKMYLTLPESPYYSDTFQDRIVYSDINIQDLYKNGYRTFKTASINDYTKQYGSITKLVDWYGHILCIFEHGVGILPVNERVESGEGIGGPVFIDNNKVLPDVPSMISDKFGSQWKDSIIKTPYAVYGIDASTKKIWRVTGSTTLPTLNVISDFKVENFLKEHLPNNDNEHNVLIALRNIKSHYNQTKSDVMFTFYMDKENDRLTHVGDKSKFDEEAWSLCLNEITSDQNTGNTGNFVTFYSWIPLESFNLNNKFYSFDREIVRGILSFPEIIPIGTEEPEPKELIDYIGRPVYDSNGNLKPDVNYCSDAQYYTKKYSYPNPCITGLNFWVHNNPSVRPLPTHWYGKQHPFEFEFMVIDDPSVLKIYEDLKIISNNAKPESFHFSITGDNYEFTEDMPNIYYRLEATKELYSNLGCPISYNEDYKKVHPNQLIKSTIFPLYYNRIDVYDNIYDLYQLMTGEYRDYQNLSGTEVYRNPRSRKFELVTHIKNTPIDGEWVRLTQQNAAKLLDIKTPPEFSDECMFEDWLNEFYNSYYDNRNCNTKLKKVKIPKEALECSCNKPYWYYIWIPQSRLRGNSHYKEDKWNIQIPTISLMLKNENRWISNRKYKNEDYAEQDLEVPPLILNWVPKLEKYKVDSEDLPNTYDIGQLSTEKWTFRKETKIRDKYCRIKVRYSGEELAIISAVLTTFNISYA